ncbi:MAG: Uma2 family endonuclease [Aphanocapsa sp. GSE-SYN-MK-11-07L]|jgi:Uma2 family endonuclease|nr:Uma2 family endonuclease [Aphanocapsa sp. GSE-SYN-MK-11-07L]
MLLELQRINVPPGQRVILQDVTWPEFETILEELGEHRGSRLAYEDGMLEIMMPLPEHEDDKEIIGDLVKALLEELEIEFRSLGSTTFKKPTAQGLEPDQCFYIQHEAAIRGQQRIDLSVDPPPDLAIEIDITSRTHASIYLALQVPELWRFDQGVFQINILASGRYQDVPESPNFPGLALKQMIPRYLKESKTVGRNKVLKAFRQWVREQIQA